MRDIKLCVPTLQDAWKYSQEFWTKNFPSKPQPILTCTLRTLAEQKALFAQGRLPLSEINRLRKIAGLGAITASVATGPCHLAPSSIVLALAIAALGAFGVLVAGLRTKARQ